MKARIIALSVLAGAILLPGIAVAQESTGVTPSEVVRPDPNRLQRPDLPDDLRQLIEQFREMRQDILQARQQLIERLRNATEEERRAIIAEFRVEQRERLRAERELRRQIRQQLMELRRERRRAGATG